MNDGEHISETGFGITVSGQVVAGFGAVTGDPVVAGAGEFASLGGVGMAAAGGLVSLGGLITRGVGSTVDMFVGNTQPIQQTAVEGLQKLGNNAVGWPEGAPSPFGPLAKGLEGSNPCP